MVSVCGHATVVLALQVAMVSCLILSYPAGYRIQIYHIREEKLVVCIRFNSNIKSGSARVQELTHMSITSVPCPAWMPTHLLLFLHSVW